MSAATPSRIDTAGAALVPPFAAKAVNLADARLGAAVEAVSDEFFAAASRMLAASRPIFVHDLFDDNGKWMDGWETRRRRGPGHDFCVVKLAAPGMLAGAVVETSFFTGNYPPACRIEALPVGGDPNKQQDWLALTPMLRLRGDDQLAVPFVPLSVPISHVRLSIFPDGGVARLRIYGQPVSALAHGQLVDLASMLAGGRVVAVSDAHFGEPANMLLPGESANMGQGWETRRRREPGFDWCLIALAKPGTLERIEVGTAHFKGNYPQSVSIQGAYVPELPDEAVPASALFWPYLLESSPLGPDQNHVFPLAKPRGPVSHVRVNIHPDGGLSRVRLWGQVAEENGDKTGEAR